jgi:magnesium transporter
MTLRPVQIKHLKNLFQIGNDDQITHAIEKIHPSDLSLLFSELNELQTKRLVDCLLMVQKAGNTLKEIPEFMLPDILELISNHKLSLIIGRLDTDDAVYLLNKVPEGRYQEIFSPLDSRTRLNLEKLLLYPQDSAGSVMNPVYYSIPVESTVEEAIASLQKFPDRESVFYVYVVDGKQLVGVVPLRVLVLSDAKDFIRDVMTTGVMMVEASSDQEKAAQLVSQYNLLAIPVVNENKELLGVITVDDVIDIFEEEATEDLYNIAGLSGEDRAFTPVTTKIRKRFPWILLNLGTAFMAAMVVGLFEQTISQFALLAAYMPVVAGIGGNSGTQSMVVITRSIALGEIEFSKAYIAVFKEVMNGLFLGIIAGMVAAGVAFFVNMNAFLGVILFMSMMVNMILAGFMGSCVPLILKWLKLDPAIGAGIFVTATTDITGFFVFLGFAELFIDKL